MLFAAADAAAATRERITAVRLAPVAVALWAALASLPVQAADSAVVFMYHRFGENAHPSTNITLPQFGDHIEEIERGDYNVVPLGEVVDAFRRKEALPDRTIALSIDDAFLSVYREAWPRLRRAGIPFTLFVATDPIDRRQAGYMSWEQIRELAAAGVAIGSQTASHPHLPEASDEQLKREFEQSNRRFAEELGFTPRLLAYPFGEFGAREKAAAEAAGFTAAFGQHSGVAHANADLFALPRFAMNENYGSLSRFRLAANALPLRVFDVTPQDTVLRDNNPPPFGFTVEPGLKGVDRLACFASNQEEPAHIERLGERRLEVRLEKPFAPGRGRINCTMPAANDRWRWYGIQFYIPRGE